MPKKQRDEESSVPSCMSNNAFSLLLYVIIVIIISSKLPQPEHDGTLLVLGHAKRVVAAVEGNKLGLEEDITINGEVGIATGLNTTEAGC